jgi:hypothetical protein
MSMFLRQHLTAPLGGKEQVCVKHKDDVTACLQFNRPI